MSKTLTCLSCSSKFCEKSEEGTFDICQYGISFLNRNGNIETKEPKVPLSTIAKNLRHEINPILQAIIQQATIIDPSLSTKIIYPDKPLSLIVGSTVVLDNFIQMITGVHEFHSTPSNLTSKKIKLKSIVDVNYVTYGIIKENGRTKGLKLNNHIPENYTISKCSDFIKYTLAVLIDNAWKYSIDDSTLTVNINKLENGNYRLKLTNKSEVIPEGINIFEMGSKVDPSSKGFGYGLSWVKTLQANYNTLLRNESESEFKVQHNQLYESNGLAFQEFILDNIKIDEE
jgi:K+-sensing histidine kinase KdpD